MVVQLQKELAELKKKWNQSVCICIHVYTYYIIQCAQVLFTACSLPLKCSKLPPLVHKFPRNVHGQFPKLVKHLFTGGEQSWISLSTPVYFAVIVHWDSSVDCAILYIQGCMCTRIHYVATINT